MAYLNDHDIYCDPERPTPGCKECEIAEEQRKIEEEEERELEQQEALYDECAVCDLIH